MFVVLSVYVGSKFCKCIINENGRVKISIDYGYFIKNIYVMALVIRSRVKRRLLLIISLTAFETGQYYHTLTLLVIFNQDFNVYTDISYDTNYF